MMYEKEIESLESEWFPEDGFFWEIRQGRFNPDAFDRALAKIRMISIEENSAVPRRVVSLLWYIPLFMQWQADRVRESKGDVAAYARATTMMANEIERLLGVP
jgi:hypothetical protein